MVKRLSGLALPSVQVFRKINPDVRLALVLFLAGCFAGWLFCSTSEGTPHFYQNEFGPAVMFAGGHGFVNIDPARVPPVREFLALRAGSLKRADIPENLPTIELNVFHKAHRYLLLLVGFWWRITEISWRGVFFINALLYGFAAVAVYAIFRLVFGRPLSITGTMLMCFSVMQLQNLFQLRDYAKAPFILASIAIMGAIALKPSSGKKLTGLSALAGAILGIGTGFRPDVEIFFALFVAVVVLFGGDRPWRSIPEKMKAIAISSLVFALIAGPIIASLSSAGGNLFHAILLGFSDPFDSSLGISPSLYGFGSFYNDTYVTSIVSSFAQRIHHLSPAFPSGQYDQMGLRYLEELSRHFPADFLARFLGAIFRILALPFASIPDHPFMGRLPFQTAINLSRDALYEASSFGIWFVCFLLVAATVRRLKDGLFLLFMLAAVAGYPSLQFSSRHFFYLQFLSIIAALFTFKRAGIAVSRIVRTFPWNRKRSASGSIPTPAVEPVQHPAPGASGTPATSGGMSGPFPTRAFPGALVRLLILALVICVLGVFPLLALRRYQTRAVAQLFTSYLAAEKETLHPLIEKRNGRTVLLHWDDAARKSLAPGVLLTEYLLIELACQTDLCVENVALEFEAESAYNDYSRSIAFEMHRGTNRLLIPVYSFVGVQSWRFIGLAVSEHLLLRPHGFFRFTNLNDKPLLLDIRIPAGWENERLFQALSFERGPVSVLPNLFQARANPVESGSDWINRLLSLSQPPQPDQVDRIYSDMVHVNRDRIAMDGRVAARYSYLVQFHPRQLGKGTLFAVKGRLDQGGLAIGLLENNQWHNQVMIDKPGPFLAVVEAVKDGVFMPMITNATSRAIARNRFSITDIGFLNPETTQ